MKKCQRRQQAQHFLQAERKAAVVYPKMPDNLDASVTF